MTRLGEISTKIVVVQKTVYRGATRHYFTKGGAAGNIARAMMREHCTCVRADNETGSPMEPCKFHGDDYRQHFDRIKRYVLTRQTR